MTLLLTSFDQLARVSTLGVLILTRCVRVRGVGWRDLIIYVTRTKLTCVSTLLILIPTRCVRVRGVGWHDLIIYMARTKFALVSVLLILIPTRCVRVRGVGWRDLIICVSRTTCSCISVVCDDTEWPRPIGYLIFIVHFLQKSHILDGSITERDLHLKASCGSSPPCTHEVCVCILWCFCIYVNTYSIFMCVCMYMSYFGGCDGSSQSMFTCIYMCITWLFDGMATSGRCVTLFKSPLEKIPLFVGCLQTNTSLLGPRNDITPKHAHTHKHTNIRTGKYTNMQHTHAFTHTKRTATHICVVSWPRAHTYIYTHTYTRTHTHTHAHTRTHAHICVVPWPRTQTHIHTHTHTHAHTGARAHTHTHAHAHTRTHSHILSLDMTVQHPVNSAV